ncbi:MAG: MarR family transcriptional regulator [Candidatus Thorarchaeota archaeon]
MRLPFGLTKSSIVVLDKLANEGPMYPQEIADKVGLAPRTVTLALSKLMKHNLCRKVANFQDMRKPLYHADIERFRKLEKELDIWKTLASVRVRA